jgi:adenylylsulfate kinase-like enzyme
MIYWFTGQPAHGKTVLANKLHERMPGAFRIDGDDMRELFSNKDYSIKGRVENVGIAQRLSHYLHNKGYNIIVSLVSPYIDQREDFKALLGDNIKEIYVHTTEKRERDHFKAIAYVAPTKNFINIDTTNDTPKESLKKILDAI